MDKQKLDIEKTREKLIGHWLYNFKEKQLNNEILFIDIFRSDLFIVLKKNILEFEPDVNVLENGNFIHEGYVKNCFFDKNGLRDKNKLKLRNRNIIAIPFLDLSFEHFRNIDKPVLFLVANFVKNENEIKSIFKKISENIEEYKEPPFVPKQMRYYFYIEPINPIELIKSENLKALREFLMFKLFDYKFNIEYIKQPIEAIIAKTNFERYHHNDELLRELICRDLSLFENNKILTARLGVVLYKVATLNSRKSITAIGRYYHNELKISSKNFYSVYQEFSDDFKESEGVFKAFCI